GPGREGHFAREIKHVVSDLGLDSRVSFAGQVTADVMAELMCAADVLTLASTREGWPNVVHEAMACGLPVVATDVGAVPDMIPAAEYGFVVPVTNDDALLEALVRALDRAWNRETIAAWAQSRSWELVAAEVLKQFEQINSESSENKGESTRRVGTRVL